VSDNNKGIFFYFGKISKIFLHTVIKTQKINKVNPFCLLYKNKNNQNMEMIFRNFTSIRYF